MIRNLFISIATAAVLLFGFTAISYANIPTDQIVCGANGAAGENCTAKPSSSVSDLIAKIINILSLLAGAVAVIMIIVGGFRYVTSAGNDSAVAESKKTIVYALIGLIIIAVAQVIVHFVLNNV